MECDRTPSFHVYLDVAGAEARTRDWDILEGVIPGCKRGKRFKILQGRASMRLDGGVALLGYGRVVGHLSTTYLSQP